MLWIALFGFTLIAAAEECADVPLCKRLAAPRQVFFAGEAIAERQREGRPPEYLFQVREVLSGLAPATETVIVETSEGTPPAGWLLMQAHLLDDGVALGRGECDYVAPESASIDALAALRRSADASLAVSAIDARGHMPDEVRIAVDGPISRMADRDGRFYNLVPGAYRVTVTAPGYRTTSQAADLPAGSCPAIVVNLPGAAEIAGVARPGEIIQAFDAASQAVVATASAGSDGQFRLSELPPGQYVLSNGSLFYPGFPHRADASVIDLGPGVTRALSAWHPK